MVEDRVLFKIIEIIIFLDIENINQGGKRLTLFDLVHASVWTSDFDLRDLIREFNDESAIKLFGKNHHFGCKFSEYDIKGELIFCIFVRM